MDSELEDLCSAFTKRSLPAHWHPAQGPGGACVDGEVCISDGDGFTAVVRAPDRGSTLYVDPMTAWGVVEDAPEDASLDALWAELESIDHGE